MLKRLSLYRYRGEILRKGTHKGFPLHFDKATWEGNPQEVPLHFQIGYGVCYLIYWNITGPSISMMP
jgi:hypothetical protein